MPSHEVNTFLILIYFTLPFAIGIKIEATSITTPQNTPFSCKVGNTYLSTLRSFRNRSIHDAKATEFAFPRTAAAKIMIKIIVDSIKPSPKFI